MIVRYFSKFNLTSIYYTLFEGLSKGGNQILLILTASVISKSLYVQLMLLISFESLLTLLFLSSNNDFLYAVNRNKHKKYIAFIVDTTFFQSILFYVLYLSFKRHIDSYFNYDLSIIIVVIILITGMTNVVRFYSTSYQIDLDHNIAIRYKSLPFFFSFITCVTFFLIFQDKIFAFFVGRLVGLLLFFFYIIYKHRIFHYIFSTDTLVFNFVFKRLKFSFLTSLLGWATSIGFFNFSKIISDNEEALVVLGLTLNIFSILQLFANGINQVYVPNLRTKYLEAKEIAVQYSLKILRLYFRLSIFFVIVFLFALLFSPFLVSVLPNLETYLSNGNVFLVVVLFLIVSFQWIAAPYFSIMDKFKDFFYLNLIINAFAWLTILLMYFGIGLSNFVVFYFILKTIVSASIFFYVLRKLIWQRVN